MESEGEAGMLSASDTLPQYFTSAMFGCATAVVTCISTHVRRWWREPESILVFECLGDTDGHEVTILRADDLDTDGKPLGIDPGGNDR